MNDKKLRKSKDRKIAGVCGGIAEYFEIDPTLVRLGWAIMSIFSAAFPGIICYAVAAFILPD